MTENLLADDVQPVGVISPVGCARGPEVFVEVAVFREREGDRRIRVKRRRLHDAEGALPDERRLLHGGDRRDRLLDVRVVVEERLARRRLLEGLLAHEVDDALPGEVRLERLGLLGRRQPDLHRLELGLEPVDLRLVGRVPRPLRRHRDDRRRPLHDLRGDLRPPAGGAEDVLRLDPAGIAVAHGSDLRLDPRPELAPAVRLLRVERLPLRLPLLLRGEHRAELRRVPGRVAVAALVAQQRRADHLRVGSERVLDPVGVPLSFGLAHCLAEHAAHLGGRHGEFWVSFG